MTRYQKLFLILLRLALGWMFLYSGFTKIMDPAWSAAGYLNSASAFSGFYHWLASPAMLPLINFVNEWGQLLLGISLILGIFVRFSSILGAALMIMYYLPILKFPYPNNHSFIVDEHIIYALALLLLGAFSAGRIYGLENWCANLPICRRFPVLRRLLG
jgi:thiosulfate dehydrogenase (quinone) large subunit